MEEAGAMRRPHAYVDGGRVRVCVHGHVTSVTPGEARRLAVELLTAQRQLEVPPGVMFTGATGKTIVNLRTVGGSDA
jgi:hypothetical protein